MKKILTVTALVATILVIAAFAYMQPRLVPQLVELTPFLEGVSIFIVIAYIIMGIFHLVMLKTALTGLSGRFVDSLFLAGVVFSGVTLLSDAVQLSEIGKEYLYWDVSVQWYFLYGFAAVHLVVAVAALIKVKGRKNKNAYGEEDLFSSLNQMILIASTAGLAGIIASSIWMPVALEYMPTFVILVAGLSFVPVGVFVVYWILRKRKTKVREWFDEKQLSDIAFAASMSFVFSLPVYLAAFATEALDIYVFRSYVWIMMLFFIQAGIFSAAVLARTGSPGD